MDARDVPFAVGDIFAVRHPMYAYDMNDAKVVSSEINIAAGQMVVLKFKGGRQPKRPTSYHHKMVAPVMTIRRS